MSILKGAKAIGAYIGMSVATFHRHKDLDGIPYFRAGRTICAQTEKLDAWMERGGSGSNSGSGRNKEGNCKNEGGNGAL